MSKFVCSVCGYVYEGDAAPEKCPICKAPASKFVEQGDELTWAAEHVVGVAQGAPEEIIQGLWPYGVRLPSRRQMARERTPAFTKNVQL